MNRIIPKTIIVLFLLTIFNITAMCDIIPTTESVTLHFLKNILSSSANGMGGLVINNVDEQAALYNPGAYGLFFMNHTAVVSFPYKIKWFPELADDIELKGWNVGIGTSKNFITGEQDADYDISFGFSYGKQKHDYGTIPVTDPLGNVIGYANPYDKFDFYTFSIGFEHIVKLGFGYTRKKIESVYTDNSGSMPYTLAIDPNAYDYGFYVELPIQNLVNGKKPADKKTDFDVIFSVAYVRANNGDDVVRLDVVFTDKLPKIRRTGAALEVNYKQDSKIIYGVRIGYENEEDMVNHIVNINKYGLQGNVYNSLFFRVGQIDMEGNETINTFGFGVSLKGFIHAFQKKKQSEPSSFVDSFWKNADLKFDWSRWSQTNGVLDNTHFLKLSLSF